MHDRTARKYFTEVVLPAYFSFVDGYANREIGLSRDTERVSRLADSLLNLPEYVFAESASISRKHRSKKAYRKSVWLKCPDYELCCDIAIAWKHGAISRQGRRLTGPKDIVECIAIVRNEDDEGIYTWSRKVVELRLAPDDVREVSPVLRNALLFWCNELIRIGTIPQMPSLPILFPALLTRDDLRGSGKMRILAHKLEKFSNQFKAYAYAPETDTISPADGQSVGVNAVVECEMTVLESPYDL